jgi:hypothetical protein
MSAQCRGNVHVAVKAHFRDTKMNELIVIEKIAQWEKLKTLVLDSVSSPITKRVHSMARTSLWTGSKRRRSARLHQGHR